MSGEADPELLVGKRESFLSSPRVTAWVTFASFIVGVIGLIPSAAAAIGYPVPGVEFVFGFMLAFVFLVSLYAVAQSKRHYATEMAALRMIRGLKQSKAGLQQRLTSAEQANTDLKQAGVERNKYVCEMFRSLAKRRALSSLSLNMMRESSTDTDLGRAAQLRTEWLIYKEFLKTYCTLVSDLFTKTKGGRCHCNIKLFFMADDIGREHQDIDFGVGQDSRIAQDTYYITVANCHHSGEEQRFVEHNCAPVLVSENVIFRRMFVDCKSFISNDIPASIDGWQEETVSNYRNPFKYPDKNPLNYLRRMMASPIYVFGQFQSREGVAPFERIIGVLTVDANEIDGFDETTDQIYCEQLAYDLASSYFEYAVKPR
jgi:hypothetical protein